MPITAAELLGLQHAPAGNKGARTLAHERHAPRSLDQMCDQADAVGALRAWQPSGRPLAVVGRPGVGKSLAVSLLARERGWRFWTYDELPAGPASRAGESARLLARSGPDEPAMLLVAHGEHLSVAELRVLLSQKLPRAMALVLECTDDAAAIDARDVLRKCDCIHFAEPDYERMCAWIEARGLSSTHASSGDVRASLLQCDLGLERHAEREGSVHMARAACARFPESDLDAVERAAEALSDACMAHEDVGAHVAGMLARAGLVRDYNARDRAWSTMGSAGARHAVLRAHASARLPRSAQGMRPLFDAVWHAPLASLDKRGLALARAHRKF